MIYEQTITVPPNTPEASPVEILIRPGLGRVLTCQILFLEGSLGAVGVRLMDENCQFAPRPSGWFFDSASWVENRKLQGPPFRVTVQGYSTALDWSHSIRIRLEITR
jgi:hypothetical protein